MQTYEQLSGEKGKKIYYRAERFPAGPLFGKLSPSVEIDDEQYGIQDISMTGFALLAPTGRLVARQVGETVDYRIRVGQDLLHEGSARISRVHRGAKHVVVGLGLVTDYLDVTGLVTKQQDLLVRHELAEATRPSDDVDPNYKLLVADVLDMLRRYESFLARQKRVTNGVKPIDENAAAELLGLCEERIIPEWRALWRRANELIMPLIDDPEALRAVKLYTERMLTPVLLAGPIWRRAYEKPLGYPGDYLFMNQIYDWTYEGGTLFEKLLHRLGLEVGHCVSARMEAMWQTISEAVDSRIRKDVVRITSVGAGPAHEVYSFLSKGLSGGSVEFTLIDQEKQALAHGYDKIYPLTIAHSESTRVSCLHVSFMEMLRGLGDAFPVVPQDLIYSMGLIDYLPARRAQSLIGRLYRQLAPGGSLVIGNLKKTAEGPLWPMELVCDWSLLYRDEAEMRALAEGLDAVEVEVKEDRTGQVLLLYLNRR
jgi:hypothetical protein